MKISFSILVLLFFLIIVYASLGLPSGKPTLIGFFILVFILYILRTIFDEVDKTTTRFSDGIQGESQINKVLETLPNDYFIFRNFQLNQQWDIDFVVVGPTGVFTVEVKSHLGNIGFDGKYLTQSNHRFQEKDVLWQAMNQSMQLHDFLLAKINHNIFVAPVIVFSSTKVGMHFGLKKLRGVYVIQKQWLVDLITKNVVRQTVDVPLVEKTLAEYNTNS